MQETVNENVAGVRRFCKTCDNGQQGKNSEYHVVVVRRGPWTDKNCPTENTWPNHVENEQHIGSKINFFFLAVIRLLLNAGAGSIKFHFLLFIIIT